jgi:hypothetical protein
VGSTRAAPSPTALAYADLARTTLLEGQAALDAFVSTELNAFARAVSAAGIGLFGDGAQP